jgi:hypothetical protein
VRESGRLENATQALHRLTSYAPGHGWDQPADDPRVVQDLRTNDMDRFPWFFKQVRVAQAVRIADQAHPLAHAFEVVGVHRVELQVYAFNPRARHVYDKIGFSYEGTRRQALCWDGQWIDSHVMAILASEWQAGRASGEV